MLEPETGSNGVAGSLPPEHQCLQQRITSVNFGLIGDSGSVLVRDRVSRRGGRHRPIGRRACRSL